MITEDLENKIKELLEQKDQITGTLKEAAKSAFILSPDNTIKYTNAVIIPEMKKWDAAYLQIKAELAGEPEKAKEIDKAHAELDYHFGQIIENTDNCNPNYLIHAKKIYQRANQYFPDEKYKRAAERVGNKTGRLLRGEWE